MSVNENDGSEISSMSKSDAEQHANSIETTSEHSIVEMGDDRPFLTQRIPLDLTCRQLAEIQLFGIMKDPELTLPHLVNSKIRIELNELGNRLHTQIWLIKRVLRILDIVEIDFLSMHDVRLLTRVLTGPFDVRVLLFFNMIDTNNDQQVTREELTQFFIDYLDGIASLKVLNEIDNGERRQTILKIILNKFHLSEASFIDFEQFHELVVSDELLIETLSKFTVHPTWFDGDRTQENNASTNGNKQKQRSLWTVKGMMLLVLRNKVRLYQSLYDNLEKTISRDYIYENIPRALFFIIYLAVTIVLLVYEIVVRIQEQNHWLEIIAHICGMQLNFNCMLMIALMLRQTARIIRTSSLLRALVPVDDTIRIHKMVGRWITVLVVIHAVCHMIYFKVEGNGYSWPEIIFTAQAQIGWLHITPVLGIVLIVVLAIMVIFSMKFVRRGGHFELFYWTHALYVVFYILLILHARNFWHWFTGPAVIFIIEKIYSLYKRHSTNKGQTLLSSVTIEQSNVIKLSIQRPPQFRYKSGDYVLLNIPHVARCEWHPFTLSSAPEDRRLLTVHLQAAGNWTNKVVDRYKQLIGDGPKTLVFNGLEEPIQRVWIDGPYASNARHIPDCKHIILIGAGIGITPYASILSSLLSQYRDGDYREGEPRLKKRLAKLDFVWVSRSMNDFEWFLKVLANFEEEQELFEHLVDPKTIDNNKRFLDIHLYFTDIKQDVNIGSVPLDLIARLYEQVCQKDVFTRLQAKTHMGRPNWNKLFDEILNKDNDDPTKDVGVFFCGPKTMAETVKEECTNRKISFHKEQF